MKTHKEKSDYLTNLFSKVYLTDVIDRYMIVSKKIIIQKEKILPHYDDNGIYITCLEDFLMEKW